MLTLQRQTHNSVSIPIEHRSLLHIDVGAFFSSIHIYIIGGCLSQHTLLFGVTVLSLTTRDQAAVFTVFKRQTQNSMQKALRMPLVLRAAITAKQWIAKENKFATAIMEETVTNMQFLAVFMVMVGLILFLAMPVSLLYPAIGFVLMYKGGSILKNK